MSIALTLATKVALATVAGVAVVAPTTYFAVKGFSSNISDINWEFITKNCGNFPIKAVEKEKIIVCGVAGENSPSATFYLYKDKEEINSKNFNKEKMTKINSLTWKGKLEETSNQPYLLVTLEGKQEQTRITAESQSDDLPNQDVDNLETNCTPVEWHLRCNNTNQKGESIAIGKFQEQGSF